MAKLGSAWPRHGAPVALSVLLGAGAAVLTNLATAGDAGPMVIASLVTSVLAWAGWEGWRAIRAAGVSGPSITGKVRVGKLHGTAIGVDARSDAIPSTVEGEVQADTVHRGGRATGVHLRNP